MRAGRLLTMKLGFQWHKATGEPIESHAPRKGSGGATQIVIRAPCGRASWWPLLTSVQQGVNIYCSASLDHHLTKNLFAPTFFCPPFFALYLSPKSQVTCRDHL